MRPLFVRLREQRKVARVLGVIGSVAVLLIAVLVFITLKSLPSVPVLRAKYFSSRLHRPIRVQTSADTSGDTVSGTTTAAVSMPKPSGAQINPQPAANETLSLADYVADRFVERGDRSLNVCDSLTDLKSPMPIDTASFSRALQQQMRGTTPNPFADAALAPLGAMLQLSDVADVVTQIRDAQDSGDLSLLKQAEFYSTVAYAAANVYQNKNSLDQISEHAYHLSVLSRIASLVPTIANDSTFQNYCGLIEDRVTSNTEDVTPTDLDVERAGLMELIGTAGLTPQQAGFEPNVSTAVAVSINPESVTFSSPWMLRMYGTGLLLNARP